MNAPWTWITGSPFATRRSRRAVVHIRWDATKRKELTLAFEALEKRAAGLPWRLSLGLAFAGGSNLLEEQPRRPSLPHFDRDQTGIPAKAGP
mmetsp:Transcript_20631/g.60966  ORF Transcript_20631/g.60966 Transcript_20631/m.60966 type:complete len:92 (+) Transcript_20631:900-1175(+)